MIPAQILSTSGPWVDNRRGNLTVEREALDLAVLTVQIPPSAQHAGTTHKVYLAGEHLASTARDLRRIADELEAVASVDQDAVA